MDWRLLSVGALFLYGFGTYFVAKATPVHGQNNAAFLQIVCYVVLLAVMGFGNADLARFTKASLAYGAVAAAMFVVGSYFIFTAIGRAPEHAALVEGLVAAHFIVSGLLVHCLIKPMTPVQWLGIIVILGGVILTIAASPSK